MGRIVNVYMYGKLAGILIEDNDNYIFSYDDNYKGKPISLSMPLTNKKYVSCGLHPFFKSLAPEGWLKKRYSELQKIDERDTFGFLIENGHDLLGAISVEKIK
jgi:serine/threonine-protein kinase HipA